MKLLILPLTKVLVISHQDKPPQSRDLQGRVSFIRSMEKMENYGCSPLLLNMNSQSDLFRLPYV